VAAGIVAAPLVSLAVVPLAVGHRAATAPRAAPLSSPVATPRFGGGGGAFAAAVLVIMLSEQIFLNAGPLLIRAEEGAAEAGYIFNVLMVARAPLLVFQGIAISLLPHLTRLRSRGGDEATAAFEVSVGMTLRAIIAFTALVALVVAIAGPALMQAAFSDRFSYDRAGLLIVTGAMGLYLAATTLNQAALAQGRARRACAAWSVCALGFLVWSLLPVLEPDRRIEVGFLGAAAVLFCLLRLIYRDPRDRDAPGLTDAEEVEAGLALADEAS
jgi:O-antigen/teichoic acid export membrane protein